LLLIRPQTCKAGNARQFTNTEGLACGTASSSATFVTAYRHMSPITGARLLCIATTLAVCTKKCKLRFLYSNNARRVKDHGPTLNLREPRK
jgi:hypothetical protein